MKGAFFSALVEAASADDRIFLVVADVGFNAAEGFASRFPERFLNVGVAEQNMISVAAGLALSGKVVFAYSIANFASFRCLEQIRNDVCQHAAAVKVVAIGGGFSYGALGQSHHAIQDLAIMRPLRGITVMAPGDVGEAQAATHAAARLPGPVYLRLERSAESVVHEARSPFVAGKARLLSDGRDATIISTGTILGVCVAAARQLASEGVDTRLLSMHTVQPLDRDAVLAAARETRAILTVEEHVAAGGLGSAVADVLAGEAGLRARFGRIAVTEPYHDVGTRDYLRRGAGLDVPTIVARIHALLQPAAAA
jgi:transketolase